MHVVGAILGVVVLDERCRTMNAEIVRTAGRGAAGPGEMQPVDPSLAHARQACRSYLLAQGASVQCENAHDAVALAFAQARQWHPLIALQGSLAARPRDDVAERRAGDDCLGAHLAFERAHQAEGLVLL